MLLRLITVTSFCFLFSTSVYAQDIAGSITFKKGTIYSSKSDSGPWNKLKAGSKLYQGDIVKTGKKSRLELTLQDGSIVRLGSDSRLRLSQTKVNKVNKKKKKISMKLFAGRIWTKVTSLFGSSSKFEVETDNAVAGVRGTTFRVSHNKKHGTAVHVYSGNVLVSNQPTYKIKGHTKKNRVAVSGPQEISQKKWMEIIAGALESIKVASNGDMSKATKFDETKDQEDEWVAWNKERDTSKKQ